MGQELYADKIVRISDSRDLAQTPPDHAPLHKSGGAQVISLDELGTATDNTNLDATTSAHGLMPKADKIKIDGIETSATADQTDAEIETAYNNQVPKVSAGEIAAGTEAAVRRYSPADVKAFIDAHVELAGVQNKLDATVDPTVNDDSGSGYAAGSFWLNQTSDEAFKCFDASVGAAIWVKTTLTVDELATVAVTGDYTDLSNIPSSFTPSAHASTHVKGGSDQLRLDDLNDPQDNTDLNVSTTAHGLTPKLPNDSGVFLNGLGAYTAPVMQVVSNASAASAANEGQFRYRVDGNNRYLEFSIQTGAATYAWVIVVGYSW